jgi:hypothetical protein
VSAPFVKLVLIVVLAIAAVFARVAPAHAAVPLAHDSRDDDRDDDDDRDRRPPKDPPKDPPKGPPAKGPSAKVRGTYALKIAGYYRGSGEAHASGSGIKINGKVEDPKGNRYTLTSKQLEVTNDRFRGTGTLNSLQVEIDGRLDPKDDGTGEVLKRGRITLTFRAADGHFGRAAGEMKESAKETNK